MNRLRTSSERGIGNSDYHGFWGVDWILTFVYLFLNSAAQNATTGEGIAVKKVTNVFSKKILAKRALREIKLLQHFRGMKSF